MLRGAKAQWLSGSPLISGGRDRHGGAIIVFPSHGEFVEFSYSDVVSVLSYLSQIPEEIVRSRGYTIVVDMRHAWIRYLKTVLKAIQVRNWTVFSIAHRIICR